MEIIIIMFLQEADLIQELLPDHLQDRHLTEIMQMFRQDHLQEVFLVQDQVPVAQMLQQDQLQDQLQDQMENLQM